MKFNFLYSIRFRLILWFAAILAFVLFAFSAFIYFSQARDIRGDALSNLGHKAELIAEALKWGAIPPNILQEKDIYLLVDLRGQVLSSQGLDTEDEMVNLILRAQNAVASADKGNHYSYANSWVEEHGDDHTHYMFIVGAASKDALLIIGSPFDPYDLNGRLLFTLLLGSGFTLAVALGGGWWLADRAMRPVKTTRRLRALSANQI